MERSRAEHLAWAKQRALAEVDRGDLVNAIASLTSDLMKHPDFQNEITRTALTLGLFEYSHGPEAVRHWIEGFN